MIHNMVLPVEDDALEINMYNIIRCARSIRPGNRTCNMMLPAQYAGPGGQHVEYICDVMLLQYFV